MGSTLSDSCKRFFGRKEPVQEDDASEWLYVNPSLIIGIVGASISLAWYFSLLLQPTFLADTGIGFSPILQIANFALWLFISSFILGRAAGKLQEHRIALMITALVCGVMGSLPLVPSGEMAAFVFAIFRAACAGTFVSLSMTLWIEFLCTQFKNKVRSSLATFFALALLWTFCIMMADARYAPFLLLACAVVSPCIYLFLWRRFVSANMPPSYDVRESDKRCKITWSSSLLTIMASLVQGFSLAWLIMAGAYHGWMPLLIGGISFVVSAMVLFDTFHGLVLRETLVRKFFLPVLATCILVFLFIPEPWAFIPAIAAFCFSLIPYTLAGSATCEHIVTCQLSTLRIYTRTRLCSTGGLCLGLVVGYASLYTQLFGEMTRQIWIVIIVVLLIVVFSLLSSRSHYPGEEDEVLQEETDGQILTRQDIASIMDGRQHYINRCNAVAEEYGLTERQREVLYLLAKGRNTAYIRDELVISPHTVKAHVYAIYKKTGQHSQQDLIDLVEGVESGKVGAGD